MLIPGGSEDLRGFYEDENWPYEFRQAEWKSKIFEDDDEFDTG